MREAPYRVAIVGTGGIAEYHARDLARLGGRAELAAAADVDAGRLGAFADRWSVPLTFTSVEEMLRRAAPDVVHLCTPPALHREQALACLAAGVTTLCEKPPALSLADLDDLAAAETGGGRFATMFQHRFGAGARRLRRLVGGPVLGRSLTAVCNTLWYRADGYFTAPWRGRWETEGGGPTMGHGIHQMDLLLAILGPWREVAAVADRRARATATEDLSAAIVTFADGTVATVVNSLVSPRETTYLRWDLEHATVELEHLYGYHDGDWTVTPAPGHERPVTGAWASEAPETAPTGHAAQFRAVLDALDRDEPPPVTLPDVRPTLELVTAIYASAFTGERVHAGQLTPDSPFYHRMDGPGAPWDHQREDDRAVPGTRRHH